MKVAIITAGTLPVPAVRGGAVETLVENLAQENEKYRQMELTIISIYDPAAAALAKRYRHTRFIFVRPGRLVAALDKWIYTLATNVLRIGGSASYRYLLQRYLVLRKAARILATDDFDKVILENSATLFRALKYRHNAQKYAGKYYFHIHNRVTGSYGCTSIIQHCQILAVSRYIQKTLPDFMQRIPGSDLHVVPNGIDTDRFNLRLSPAQRAARRQSYHLAADDFVLLFTGRIVAEKGIREVIQAFCRLNRQHLKLFIVGGSFFSSDIKSKFEQELRMMIDRSNRRRDIVFTGFIPYQRMPLIYALADIAVLPSMWNEPAGLTMLEAMAGGLPVITTDAGGIPEYVHPDCAVILKHDQDMATQLTAAIQALIGDNERRINMATAGASRAQSFNLDVYYFRFLQEIAVDVTFSQQRVRSSLGNEF
ncbi:MAG: glycosyltransferase family 4 protein [Sporolactobacillus sp.]|jgi:glycosyltransferase involved in cell wall biosynthesis|nr:glycosyltransferase family 4 protein [Sporolactobacillus sp.]